MNNFVTLIFGQLSRSQWYGCTDWSFPASSYKCCFWNALNPCQSHDRENVLETSTPSLTRSTTFSDKHSCSPSPDLVKTHTHILQVKLDFSASFYKAGSCSNKYLHPALLQSLPMFVSGHSRGMWAAIPRFQLAAAARQQELESSQHHAGSIPWDTSTHTDLQGGSSG